VEEGDEMRKQTGFFISFEGTGEGVGKTTQSLELCRRLEAEGYNVIWTRNPGGTAFGKKVHEILLHGDANLSKASQLFLLMADRAQNYKEVLKPALQEGKIVISDRYFDSTLAYQGNADGWKAALLWRLHHAATGSLLPNLTYVLTGVPHRERFADDRFEKKDDAFHDKVRRGMEHLASKGGRYVSVDGNDDLQVVADRIYTVFKERYHASETI
jgi:dTMP kinase